MTDQDFQNLKTELEELKTILYKDNFSALQIIRKQQQLADGINLELGSSDGTKIGTATTQKLGFYNKTPVDQPATVSDANTQGAGYVQADVQSIADAVNDLISRLKELGLIA